MISIHPIRPVRRIAVVITLALGIMIVGPAPAPAQVMYTVTDLGTLGPYCYAQAINSTGQVAGWSGPSSTVRHAFRANIGGPLSDLGTLVGDNREAYWIIAAGQVVGNANIVEVCA